MGTKNFDKLKALDDFSKLSASLGPMQSPSDTLRYMNHAMDYLQSIHDNAYTQGYEDCLNNKIPK